MRQNSGHFADRSHLLRVKCVLMSAPQLTGLLVNALFERLYHDSGAQPQTANFAEYLLPMATDMPPIAILHTETASPLNPLGMKGAGEGGTIPAISRFIDNSSGTNVLVSARL